MLLKFPTNFQFPKKIQFISKKFQNYFKPNHKSPKTVEKLQPKLCKNVPPLKVKIYKPLKKNFFLKSFFLQLCKIFVSCKSSKSLGTVKSFSKIKSQKVGYLGRNTFPKYQSFLQVKVFSFFCQFLFYFYLFNFLFIYLFIFFGGRGGGGQSFIGFSFLAKVSNPKFYFF